MKSFSVKLYKYICVLVCMTALLTGGMLQATVEAAEHKVVRVGWDEDVYNNITRNGERTIMSSRLPVIPAGHMNTCMAAGRSCWKSWARARLTL